MRKAIIGAAAVAASAAIAVPAIALATNGAPAGGVVNCQSSEWTTTKISTSSTTWEPISALSGLFTTDDQHKLTAAHLSVSESGATAAFRIVASDTLPTPSEPPGAQFIFSPGSVRLHGTTTFVYTLFEPFSVGLINNEARAVTVEWRSPTGKTATLATGMILLQHFVGDRE